MVLGMSLANFTLLHVIISLIGIVTGLIVMFGLLGSKQMPGLTATFLLFTILTSATGFGDSAPLSAKLLKNGTLKTYKGFPHGMPTTEAATINADLLAFIKG